MSKKPKKIVVATEDEVAQYADKPSEKDDTRSSPSGASEVASTESGQVSGEAASGEIGEPSEAEQWKEKFLRAKAELANYQRRVGKDHAESLRYANATLLRALLPILDDLERVIESGSNHQDSAEAILGGVKLTLDNFMKVLRDAHVERIESEGKPFDPKVHEAMLEQPSPEHSERTVLQEVAKGYRLYERVLRPAKVIVSKAVDHDTIDAETVDSDTVDTDTTNTDC